MVRKELDDFFNSINPEFKQQGIEWATIDGHYWLEIRLKSQKKQGSLKSNLQKNLAKKLKKILTHANIQITDKVLKHLSYEEEEEE